MRLHVVRKQLRMFVGYLFDLYEFIFQMDKVLVHIIKKERKKDILCQ